MAGKARVNYVKGVVICHGKSELQLARYATTNLHLNLPSHSRDNGKTSIQITSLMDVLNSSDFKNIDSFLDNYVVESVGKGRKKRLLNFWLYIIMDTDDCTERQRQEFISKKMFTGHWAEEYIIPIYDTPSLEKVMKDCGILTRKISSGEKGEYYTKIFPVNSKPLSYDTKKDVETLADKVRLCHSTNLELFLDYCLSLCEIK